MLSLRPADLVVIALSFGLLSAQAPAPAPTPQSAVGRVVDQDGKPVAGAAVRVLAQSAFVDTAALLAKPAATTDDQGCYRMAVPSDQYLQVVVAAKGRQVCAFRLVPDPRPARLLPEALLIPGASLSGRVRGPDGTPLPGARVRVDDAIAGLDFATMWFCSGATTDGNGIFVVPGVPTSGLRVTVTAPGHLTRSLLAAQHSPLDLTLEHVGVVRGRALDTDGKPLAGIELYAVTVESRDGDHDPVVSDGDGCFTLTVPTKGRFGIYGYERRPPLRQFSSGLLHGPADEVVVSARPSPSPAQVVTVRCIDAATKAAIRVFHASRQPFGGGQGAQMALLYHFAARREYRDAAQFDIAEAQAGRRGSIVVDAPGHGFATAAVPKEGAEPLVLALGPESFLTGGVVDAETRKPMAGVVVRALPGGDAMGSGPDPRVGGVFTDAAGRYRIKGLRAGAYAVQAYAEGRPASDVQRVQVGVGVEAALDLDVPPPAWLELSRAGEAQPGPSCQLSFMLTHDSSSVRGFTNPGLDATLNTPLGRVGTTKLGPLDRVTLGIQLWQPSRVRLGTGTHFDLGMHRLAVGATKLVLPEIGSVLARGSVRLSEVPTERVAVLARPVREGAGEPRWPTQPHVACLEADASFVLDLPAGAYWLQLADLETGIVFHTEREPRQVGRDAKPLDLVPPLHWLEVELATEIPDGEIVLRSIRVNLPSPGVGDCRAFLHSSGDRSATENRGVPFRVGAAATQRWLVPPVRIEVHATQAFEILQPAANGFHERDLERVTVEVTKPVHYVRLTIPPPPSDEELLRGDGK